MLIRFGHGDPDGDYRMIGGLIREEPRIRNSEPWLTITRNSNHLNQLRIGAEMDVRVMLQRLFVATSLVVIDDHFFRSSSTPAPRLREDKFLYQMSDQGHCIR